MFQKSDYTYTLPPELIASEAVHPHHDARLMVIDKMSGEMIGEHTFWNLDTLIPRDRVIFFNNSRVIRARIKLQDISYTRPDGTPGRIQDGEIFYLKQGEKNTFEALVRPGNIFKIGAIFKIGDFQIEVMGLTSTGRTLKITEDTKADTDTAGRSIWRLLNEHGTLPLPPYIEYTEEKEKDYQTAFAEKDGSVAAPTASLHFTQELLSKMQNPKKYVTLHVGLGTFKGIDTDDVREYAIHRESIEITIQTLRDIAILKGDNQKVLAVGTTACRTLESLPYLWKNIRNKIDDQLDATVQRYWDTITEQLEENNWIHAVEIDEELGVIQFETSIYITPGYVFHIVDDLITNFHLPESSLLVLVSAFLGYTPTKNVYDYAISRRYRFFSFGDGMYIRGKLE